MHSYIRMAIHSINIILFLVAIFSSPVLRFVLLPFVAIHYLVAWLYNREAHKLDPIRRQFARREGWEGKNLGLNRDDWLLKTSIINIIFTIMVIIIYIQVRREYPDLDLQDIDIGLLGEKVFDFFT